MPYIRLTRTDNGRLKTVQEIKRKMDNTPEGENPLSTETQQWVNNFLPNFSNEMAEEDDAMTEQSKATKIEDIAQEKAAKYIGGFFKVFNIGIDLEIFNAADRALYKLDVNQEDLPPLRKESDVLFWGENLINGENARKEKGGLLTYTKPHSRILLRFEASSCLR